MFVFRKRSWRFRMPSPQELNSRSLSSASRQFKYWIDLRRQALSRLLPRTLLLPGTACQSPDVESIHRRILARPCSPFGEPPTTSPGKPSVLERVGRIRERFATASRRYDVQVERDPAPARRPQGPTCGRSASSPGPPMARSAQARICCAPAAPTGGCRRSRSNPCRSRKWRPYRAP